MYILLLHVLQDSQKHNQNIFKHLAESLAKLLIDKKLLSISLIGDGNSIR